MTENDLPKIESEDAEMGWHDSAYATQIFTAESPYLCQALKQISGPRVLQIGSMIAQSPIDHLDLPQLLRSQLSADCQEPISIACDPAFLPIQTDSISSVVLPHVLEGHCLPHQVLREVHRVLRSDGNLILTGFNPISILGAQRMIWRRSALQGQYYSVRRVIDWLQLLGFEVVGSAMYQYAPLTKSKRIASVFKFLNSVGDRWLPMFGGGYMISAKKRDAGITLVGKMAFPRSKRKLGPAAVAKISCKH